MSNVLFPTHLIAPACPVMRNSKCDGCLHFDANRGREGVCTIGENPHSCGAGDQPSYGYAPIEHLAPEPTLMTTSAQPPSPGAADMSYSRIAMQVVSLGEEHIDMVKSLVRDATEQTLRKSVGQVFIKEPSDDVIARRLSTHLNNRQRYMLGKDSDAVLKSFVHHARTGKSLGDVASNVRSDLLKSIYGTTEWLSRFSGTKLFDRALAICNSEIAQEEERIKKREAELAKRRKEPPKPVMESAWEQDNMRESKLMVRKRRLEVELLQLTQKAVIDGDSANKKS